MDEKIKQMIRDRFILHEGQFFGNVNGKTKNLHWYLNDEEFGFGDLNEGNILVIAANLEPGEVFKGYNEHHMTKDMQRENPMIIINCVEVLYPDRVPVSYETYAKIKKDH